MEKSAATKNRLAKYLALSLLIGAVLVIGSSNALAENATGRSSGSANFARVATINFQEPGQSGAKSSPASLVLAYVGGLVLAAFLVRTHARAVLKKSARV